jgi:hypothetical protein
MRCVLRIIDPGRPTNLVASQRCHYYRRFAEAATPVSTDSAKMAERMAFMIVLLFVLA